MTDDLKPHATYKDSGAPWLGRVPAHWEVLPNRALFFEVKERDRVDEQLLSVTISQGVIRQTDLLTNTSKKDSSNEDKASYKLVQPGDIAYNKMRAWQGAIGASQYRGIVSPAYVVVRLRDNRNPQYFHYLLRTPAFAKEAERWSYGITSDQWSLRPEHFKMIYCPVPSEAEQSAIVRFLNYTDRRIARYIKIKRRLIELLDEQKQIVVHRAVTLGLNPDVRLRPSGIEWVGDVPEHWTSVRLKQVAKVQTGITLGKDYGNQDLVHRPYLRVANVQAGRLDLTKVTNVDVPPSEAKATTLQPGDVLMTEGGDIDKLGRGCIWNGEVKDCVHQNHIFAVRPTKSTLLPEFLVALLASRHGRGYFETTAKKTTNLASTNSTTLGNFPLVLPAVDEQQRITAGITEETSSLELIQARAEREIALVREYRIRLIADVVTGKLDVRETAAKLPDEPEAPVALDEAEVLEGEEAGSEALEAVEVEAGP